MSVNKPILIHSNTDIELAREGRIQWELNNASNLDLFDFARYEFIVYAFEASGLFRFLETLDQQNPCLVMETRLYAGYYGGFISRTAIENKLMSRGIKFVNFPINFLNQNNDKYCSMEDFKSIVEEYCCMKWNKRSKIFLLTENEYHCDKILKIVGNYCSTNLPKSEFNVMVM